MSLNNPKSHYQHIHSNFLPRLQLGPLKFCFIRYYQDMLAEQ